MADQGRNLNVIDSMLNSIERIMGGAGGLPPDIHLKGADEPGELLP